MIKKLYLMRHGETLFNLQKKIQGWSDSPLTNKGINQAKKARQYFIENNIEFDYAYCSTSERCIDTLEIVTNKQMPYTSIKELKEMYYGEFEGERESLNPKTPTECETFYIPYGGESSNTVRDRMMNSLTKIMEQPSHNQVLAVSHSGACFNFLRAIQDPMEELTKGFPNCCIFIYSYENAEFRLLEVVRHDL